MGDSETLVAQTSAIMAYTSAGYTSLGHADTNANLASDTVTSATGASGEVTADVPAESGDVAISTDMMVAANTVAHNQSLCYENADNTDQNPAKEEVPNTTTNDSSEDFASFANVSMDTSQVAAYNFSLNGNDAGEAKNIVSAGINEIGITKDVHESVSEHQLVDVSALSAEEERLWSILRANSLDFDAWTALIEETEKAAEQGYPQQNYAQTGTPATLTPAQQPAAVGLLHLRLIMEFGDVQLAAWRTHRLSLENVLRLSLWHYWYPNVLWRVSNMVLASKLQIFSGRF